MENDLAEVQEQLLEIRQALEKFTTVEHPLDVHVLGQVKVQLLDLITVTELLIVTNQAGSPPIPGGFSSDGRQS